MLFPTISNDLLEALMTVVNVSLQLLKLARHLSPDACLNVLVSLGFGEAAFVRPSKPRAKELTCSSLIGSTSQGRHLHEARYSEGRGQ